MDSQRMYSAIEGQIDLLGYSLVHLEQLKEGRTPVLRLYVEHKELDRPFSLDDCVDVNNGLSAWLDVQEFFLGAYNLEVSSPGLERPLVKIEHFQRFRGRLCRLQVTKPIQGQKRFKAWIVGTTEDSVQLEEDGVLKVVPTLMIQKAHLAPFDEDKAPPPRLVERVSVREKTTQSGGRTPSRIPCKKTSSASQKDAQREEA